MAAATGTRAKALRERFATLLGVVGPRAESSVAPMPQTRDALHTLARETAREGLDSLTAACYEKSGWLAYRANDVPGARGDWRQALAVARATTDAKLLGSVLNASAVGSQLSGDNEAALQLWGEALSCYDPARDTVRVGVMWNNIAGAFYMTGRVPEALAASERALHSLRAARDAYRCGMVHIMRAEILADFHRAQQALAESDSALKQMQTAGAHVMDGTILYDRMVVLANLGRVEEALAIGVEAVRAMRLAGDELQLPTVARTRADLLVQVGKPRQALALLDSIAPVVTGGGPQQRALYRASRGSALARLGETKAAEREFAVALDVVDTLIAQASAPLSAGSLVGAHAAAYTTLARLQVRDGAARAAWSTVERGRAVGFRRATTAAGTGAHPRVDADSLLSVLDRQRLALVEISEVAADSCVAFVLWKGRIHARVFRAPAHGLDSATRLIDLVSASAAPAQCAGAAARVSEEWLHPFADLLPPPGVHLVLCPPTMLAGLPWELLPCAASGSATRTLGETWPVTYAPSGDAYATLTVRQAGRGPMLVFADPTVTAPSASPLTEVSRRDAALRAPLPEARSEGRAVASRDAIVLVGNAARAEIVREPRFAQAAVLHFATHAVANLQRPEDSALFLAGPVPEVTAGAIESLRVSTDLVTLSGCSTGRGFTYLGEGTASLARAFLIAGARSVVMTLWDVDDAVSRRFMTSFYAGLARGADRDVALQEARALLERKGVPLRDRAAFVLTGVGAEPVASMRPASRPAVWRRGWLAGGLLLALGAGWTILFRWRRRSAHRA